MRLVIIESPFSPSNGRSVAENVAYARAAVRDSLLRGEAPLASHLLYTQPGILRDDVPEEREHGMRAGWAWYAAIGIKERLASVAGMPVVSAGDTVLCAVYVDLGITGGMLVGIEAAQRAGCPVEYRHIGPLIPAETHQRFPVPANTVMQAVEREFAELLNKGRE